MKLKQKTEQVEESFSTDSRLAWFAETRGLKLDTLTHLGIHFVDNGVYEGMLAIPYPKRGGGKWMTRYRSFRETGPKYLDEPGAELHMYNPQFLGPQSPEVWFTEGEIDALVLWEYGVPAIGMSGSTKYGTVQFQQAWSLLFRGAHIVSAVDADDAGDVAHDDLVKAFGPIRRLEIPKGMDINDWHMTDSQAMKEAIDGFRANA